MKSYLDFVLLSDKDHEKLMERFGPEGTAERISRLNTYIGQIGEKKFNRKYASHYFCIIRWYLKTTTDTDKKKPEHDTLTGTELKTMKSALKRKKDCLANCDETDPRRKALEEAITNLVSKIAQKEKVNDGN